MFVVPVTAVDITIIGSGPVSSLLQIYIINLEEQGVMPQLSYCLAEHPSI
jgi:hypothetical protein